MYMAPSLEFRCNTNSTNNKNDQPKYRKYFSVSFNLVICCNKELPSGIKHDYLTMNKCNQSLVTKYKFPSSFFPNEASTTHAKQ